MMRLSSAATQAGNANVIDVREIRSRFWFRSRRFLSALLTIIVLVSISWWSYLILLKPSRDLQQVNGAIDLLESNTSTGDSFRKRADWLEEKHLIALAGVLQRKHPNIDRGMSLKASRAALDLAIHNGSLEAKVELGKALRDGVFGEKNLTAAVSQFSSLLDELQPGIKAGDPNSLHVFALMLRDGLGIESDPVKARAIVKRIALRLDVFTLERLGYSALSGDAFFDKPDLELAKAIGFHLIQNGRQDSTLGSAVCFREFDLLSKVRSHDLLDKLDKCRRRFLVAAAEKGDKDAIEELAEDAARNPRTAASRRPSPAPTATAKEAVKATDPEAQSRTGYLDGTQQVAQGGLSTFTIDNTKGGGDAIVRLYRNGKKPAARSMFVRNGESFTATALAASSYKLRYRFTGGEETFEAADDFVLSESSDQNGTRFSKVTVTLYKVANGNLSVRKVDAAEF